jgi:hypothetical protein
MTTASGKKSLKKRIHVSVDPRIELLSIVLKLSGYGDLHEGRISDISSPYLHDVEEHFDQYSHHETIEYFRGINGIISGDLPVTIVLYLSEPPALGLQTPFDAMIQARVEDESVLKQYVAALRKFAGDAEFTEFFRAHQEYYQSITALPEKSIQDGNYIELLEEYYGAQQPGYFVIFAPLLKSIAFGPRVYWDNGALEPYCIFPSVGIENGLITFKEGKALQNRILHEFGHSFVNPLVDRHQEELSHYTFLMQDIQYKTKANYGIEWNVCVYEHVVRAVTTRLTRLEFGEEAGEQEMLAHEQQGFIYIRDICDKLMEYEQSRNIYPAFVDFFSEIVNMFKELSTSVVNRELESGAPDTTDTIVNINQKRAAL